MRGKGTRKNFQNITTRITPAYAGKSESPIRKAVGVQDHPRLCGEKCIAVVISNGILGSPPPMRGKGDTSCIVGQRQRITPAYAGKRFQISIRWNLLRDHPRLCGEKFHRLQALPLLWGSPPPMRGNAKVHIVGLSPLRITPAYAGKSNTGM